MIDDAVYPSQVDSAYSREQLKRAGDFAELRSLDDVTAIRLADVAREHGCDFATALLFDRVCRSDKHGSFIRRVREGDFHVKAHEDFQIVVVPGAFHREYPHTGADGSKLIEPLRRAGLQLTIMPIPSFAPLKDGAALVADWLAANKREKTVLISLSKGGAEVKLALAQEQSHVWSRNLVGWIDLSGILEGTALVNWLERRHWRWWAIRAGLWARGQSIRTLKELERREHSALSSQTQLPAGLTAIHVVGFPLIMHLSNRWAKRGHARLAHLGPNDGGGILLADAVTRPGLLFPAWGADHYLNPAWDVQALILRLVRFVQSSAASDPRAKPGQ